MPFAAPLERLIASLRKLPGIGAKTAQRLAFHILRASRDEAQLLAAAILDVKDSIRLCSACFNITDTDPCLVCADQARDRASICVVEEPNNLVVIEKSGQFRGLYHVLHGSLSPLGGVGPDDLKIKPLLERLRDGGVKEVILATNPNVEGEATAVYLSRLLKPLGVRVTRIGMGLSIGSELEYADEVTVGKALEGRRDLLMAGIKLGLFLRIEEFARRRHRLVFLATAAIVLLSLFLGSHLTLDGDVLNLVPKHDRVINTFKEAIVDFGGLDYLLVLVEAKGDQTSEDLQEYADLLAVELRKVDDIRYVEYKIDTTGPFFAFFRRNQILFLPPSKLDELAAKLTDPAIHERVRENSRQLTGPTSFLVKQILEQDPFLISPLLLEAVLRSKGAIKVDLAGGHYLSKDGNALLLFAKPIKPAADLSFGKRLMQKVRTAVALASDEYAKEQREGGSGLPSLEFGGSYIVALEDSALIMRDMWWNGTVSFLVIVLLYYFCYRRFGAILYSSIPLMVGQFLTLGVAYLVLRRLNSATTGFTAMLMGLGTDFTIVMYARYVEERHRGKSLDEALRLMMGATAFGVFTGAITSAGTFYAMCVTEYKGLWDFGFLIGTGILLCLVAILFLLPAMIAWNEGPRRKRDVTNKLYLHSFGLEGIMTWSTRHPWPVTFASILVTAVAGYFAWHVEFSDNVQDLRAPTNRGIIVQDMIKKRFGAEFNPMMVVCRGDDVESLLRRNREANGILDGFVDDKTLLGYESILSYLPAEPDQQTVIHALHDGAKGAFDIHRIEKTFRMALAESGFREGSYDTFLGALPATLRPERPITLRDLEEAGLDRFLGRYIRKIDDGTYRSVTFIFPAGAEAKRKAPPALVAALDRPGEGMEITGVNIASTELRMLFRRDAWRAVILGLVLVTALLWLDFRSLWLTTLANIQLLVGVVWMLAAMQALGIKMNFVNAFVTTMILGVGIDYGIHIIHRISQEGLSNPTGLLETGKAVVMAAMTNVAGFGTLYFSAYPGLSSMGLVSAIGSVTCLVTALTTLPALLILTRTRLAARPTLGRAGEDTPTSATA